MSTSLVVMLREMSARSPGLSEHTTRSLTGWTAFVPASQFTSTARAGSLSRTFGQSFEWIVTPRPRVMNPTIGSPGTGRQQFPRRTKMLSIPFTMTELGLRVTTFRMRVERRDSLVFSCSWSAGRRRRSSGMNDTFPYPSVLK